MFKLVLEKAEEPEIKLPTSAVSSKKQENSRKTSTTAFIDYAKAFDCVDHSKLWEILQEMGIPDHLTWLLRNLYVGQEVTELDMEQQRLVPNQERSTSRLCIVTLLISLICRVRHAKCQAGGSTSWNPDCQEKYQ